jgi:sugar/nucleoside kinase (ribokinase family)
MKSGAQKSLVVVGSVAIDWVITPHAEREVSVGGSAVYFSMAASYHAPVQLVGVVGRDFPKSAISDLELAGVDLEGLESVSDGLTFRWKGRYHEDVNRRDTLETHLNCFETFAPKLPEPYQQSEYLFLANIQPRLQASVLEQMHKRPRFVGLDTMNLWIDIASDDLKLVLSRIDLLVVNQEEALQLAGVSSLAKAGRELQKMGPRWVVVKRGEYGALLLGPDGACFAVPALLLDDVVDPTGAGDCFAGGMMGHLAGCDRIDEGALRQGVLWGSAMASFCIQGFSYDRLRDLSRAALAQRFDAIGRMMRI